MSKLKTFKCFKQVKKHTNTEAPAAEISLPPRFSVCKPVSDDKTTANDPAPAAEISLLRRSSVCKPVSDDKTTVQFSSVQFSSFILIISFRLHSYGMSWMGIMSMRAVSAGVGGREDTKSIESETMLGVQSARGGA